MAIAAHLHVLLRRKTGRVTDTEWMATNAEYAAEIVRFAREHAASDNAPELAEWAGKLEQAVREPQATRKPTLVQAATQALKPADPPHSGFASSSLFPFDEEPPQPPRPDGPRYVGGIR
jgi:hypothetical protein